MLKRKASYCIENSSGTFKYPVSWNNVLMNPWRTNYVFSHELQMHHLTAL